jgi:leader peptidase (prepilin peptidase) / N-methyltransferase
MESPVVPGIVLALHLIAIARIDFRRLIIPNTLNLSLAVCGLVVSVFVFKQTAMNVFLACGLTLAVFLLISKIYCALRNRHGIGAGDVKFLGAAAAWTGLLGVPWVILIAAISGLTFAVASNMYGHAMKTDSRIAFGPHLSLGLMITWLLRDSIAAQV